MEKVDFQPDYPERLALKYAQGKEVDGKYGPQTFYSLTDGRCIYADPALADKIMALRLQPNEPFEVTKRKRPGRIKGYDWIVRRVEGDRAEQQEVRPEATPAAYRATSSVESSSVGTGSNSSATPVDRMASRMMACMCAMIDAAAEAQAYADRKGLKFSPEDIRCFASTAFIQLAKGVR